MNDEEKINICKKCAGLVSRRYFNTNAVDKDELINIGYIHIQNEDEHAYTKAYLWMLDYAHREANIRRRLLMEREREYAKVHHIVDPDLLLDVQDAIEALDDRDHKLFQLHFVQGVSQEEIGKIWGIKQSSVHWHLDNLRRKISKKLKAYGVCYY